MQGLLDFLKTPEGQGLLAAGFGYAAGAHRGTPLNNLGRGGMAGLLAFGQAQDRQVETAERAKMGQYRDAQMANVQAEMQARQLKIEAEKRRQAALPGLFSGGGMTGGQPAPSEQGGIPMFSQPMGVTPMAATPAGFDVMGAIRAGFSPEEIKQYAELPNVGRPKATRQMEVDDGKGGKRIALVDDFGREVAGFAGYTAPVQVNQGDRVSFVKPTPGVTLPMNMSPEARASNALGWANNALTRRGQDLTDARAREANAAGKAPAGYRWAADGASLEPIPGGPAVRQENATEGERKAATLMMRMEKSLQQLQGVTSTNKGAAKPELFAESVRNMPLVGGEAAANMVTSSDRQRVEAAQLDILDAALTLGTGAAYTREQLEGYRKSYFPQIGDSAQNVKDKQARLENVLNAARVAAGRAAPAAPSASPNVDHLLKKYGGR